MTLPVHVVVPMGTADKVAFEVLNLDTGEHALVVTRWIRKRPDRHPLPVASPSVDSALPRRSTQESSPKWSHLRIPLRN
jgi:hypothetical protein